MKKMMAFVLSAVMVLSLAACSGIGKTGGSSLQIPNPFTECETMEDAANLVGFDFDVPDAVDDKERTAIRVNAGSKLVEVIYGSEDEKAVIRKAEGSEDISGDYNHYAENTTVAVDKVQVTMKGKDGQVQLAVWTNNGYAYSIGIYAESGISSDAMTDLVAAVQ
ncbi:MAG: hypothetical protein ACI4JC_07955 [Faecalibacterium sp.]